jgi:endoglucanase
MKKEAERHPYQVVMGLSKKDFVWGSNAVAANQAIFLLQAYHLYSDKKFLDLALGNLDYILGRNGTGYSFVTGHGDKTPLHPHHRPSEADGIKEPIPGMLVGGPNPGMQDKCKYASSIPEEAYTDDVCSYASNEVAINWNAPLVYLTAAMESFQKLLEVK